jgi:hypothetical protein
MRTHPAGGDRGHVPHNQYSLPVIIGVRGARLDVATLAGVFGRLPDAGATIIVIDHDLVLLAAADRLIDMGPGGGRVLAAGTPEDVARDPGSVTGPWLAQHLGAPGQTAAITSIQ